MQINLEDMNTIERHLFIRIFLLNKIKLSISKIIILKIRVIKGVAALEKSYVKQLILKYFYSENIEVISIFLKIVLAVATL